MHQQSFHTLRQSCKQSCRLRWKGEHKYRRGAVLQNQARPFSVACIRARVQGCREQFESNHRRGKWGYYLPQEKRSRYQDICEQ